MEPKYWLLAASGWIAWAIKEIVAAAIAEHVGKLSSRSGRHGVIAIEGKMRCDTQDYDGEWRMVDYDIGMQKYPQYGGCRRFRIEYIFQIFNDSDVQVIYKNISISYIGVEGVRLRAHNPTLLSSESVEGPWSEARTIAVPAHDIVNLKHEVLLGSTFEAAEQSIRETYAGTIPLFLAKTIDRQKREFRISRSSVEGLSSVVWREKDKYPIYNHYSLNHRGRKAGKKPQTRKPEVEMQGL